MGYNVKGSCICKKVLKMFILYVCVCVLWGVSICPHLVVANELNFDTISDDASLSDEVMLTDNITINEINSFGTLLSDALYGEIEEQKSGEGCNIFEVTIDGTVAKVSFETNQDAMIIVGLYTENGEQMLCSGKIEVFKGEEVTYIDIRTENMPQYFLLRAFMVDISNYSPCCNYYESPNYTQEMQEFFKKTIDDFEVGRVLNFDEDKTNNFAVYGEDVLLISEQQNINEIVSIDNINDVYVIKNADEAILGLESGDIFSYEYDDRNLLIVKVKNIEKNGTTVTITGDNTSLDEVFEFVKINSSVGVENAEIDTSTCEEGVTYNGVAEWIENDGSVTYAIDAEGKISKALSYDLFKSELENDNGNENISLVGTFELKIEACIKVYISLKYQYVELKVDFKAKMEVELSGEAETELKLSKFTFIPVPGINITFTPAFVIKSKASISLSGELKATFGISVDSDAGLKNISSTPKFDPELKIEGTIFVGISLTPGVEIISSSIAEAKIEVLIGVELKVTIPAFQLESSSIKHNCVMCFDGEIYGKLELTASVCFFKKETHKEKFGIEIKIADFYYSSTFAEFGFESCPHITYKIVVNVKDNENGEGIQDAVINDKYTVDENGQAILYLKNGGHTLKVKKDGYDDGVKYIIVKDIGKEISIMLSKKEGVSDEDDSGDNAIQIGGVVSEESVVLDLGDYHSGVITTDGSLYMWGYNAYGQLGNGTERSTSTPVKILDNAKKLSLGERNSGAITENGSLYVWGEMYGNVPTKILDNVKAVSIADEHNGAITEDGSLYMWGSNSFGELGDGTRESSDVPIEVLDNVKSISLGWLYSMALTEEGSLYMWGHMGLFASDVPVKIMNNVKTISAGFNHCGVVTEDGSLYMWGDNDFGQLGDGTKSDSDIPIKVLDNVKNVSLGYMHSGAITEDGSLYMWGHNGQTQLGDCTGADRCYPVKVLEDAITLSLGARHTGAVTKTGYLYMWGDSGYKQLGQGDQTIIYSTSNRIRIDLADMSSTIIKWYPLVYTAASSDYYLIENTSSEIDTIYQIRKKYTELECNKAYIVCQLKNDELGDLLSADNLIYITQINSDGNGELIVEWKSTISENNSIIIISSSGDYDIGTTKYGDANSDGSIDVADGVILKKHLAGYTDMDINLSACDVNADGEVDVSDAVKLMKKLAGYDEVLGAA